jgi:pimeloyl-ACP methyl ester carboxylesterase
MEIGVRLSEISYRSDLQATQDVRELGFSGVHIVKAAGTHVVVCQSNGATWVVFRGTQLDDWHDINADRKFLPAVESRCWVHRGFKGALDTVWSELYELLSQVSGRVVFTGHSLGGALAVLAAARYGAVCRQQGVRRPDLITFGQPLVGSRQFGLHVLWCTNDVVRVTNGNDPIPWLFFWPVYRHVPAYRIHLLPSAEVLELPSRWQLVKAARYGAWKSSVVFTREWIRTRSAFRSFVAVASSFDHLCVSYRDLIQFLVRGREDEKLVG